MEHFARAGRIAACVTCDAFRATLGLSVEEL